MFSDNLTQLRKLKRMTQEDIAEAVGVSRQAVAKWETGETLPDLDKCRKLAKNPEAAAIIEGQFGGKRA